MDRQLPAPAPPSSSWLVRGVASLAGAVSQALWPSTTLRTLALGDGWGFADWTTAPAGLEAFDGDPWFAAAISAKAEDAAGLPLFAYRQEGSTKRILKPNEEPRLVRLLRRPAKGVTGREYRVQSYVDYLATGDAFSWLFELELRRLNPAAISYDLSDLDRWGDAMAWRWTDAKSNQSKILGSEVIHIRGPSGSRLQASPRGSGPIRSLAKGIQTAEQAKRLAASQAGSGQFSYAVTVPGNLSPLAREELERTMEGKLTDGKRFALFTADAKMTQLSPSMRDLEFPTTQVTSRDEIAARIGVPGTRLGILSAGYGAAKQEDRAYWGAMQNGLLAAFEDGWRGQLAEDEGIEHDLSQVASLRTVQLDQLAAAAECVKFGMTPEQALEYVGLEDAAELVRGKGKAGEGAGGRPSPAAPDPQDLDLVHALAHHLAEQGRRADRFESGADPVAVDRWRVFLADRGAPITLAAELADEEATAVQMARARASDRDGSTLAGLENLAVFGATRATRIAAEIEAARKAA